MPATDFDWNDLRAFLAVARTGKLTAAAQRMGVDHATVSRRIAALERGLKAALFHRAPTGYSLTAHGERLMPHAEAMESLALRTAAQLGEADLKLSGVVRVGAPEGFGSYFLAPRMGAWAEQHPELELQLVAIPGVVSLSKREADIAVALSPPREGRLAVRKLVDYGLSLYAAPAYLSSAPPLETRADMSAHRFIGYIEELLYAPELDYMQAPDAEIRVAFKSSNLIAQLQACLAGAGLCVLPDFIGRAEPGLVKVLDGQVGLTRALWLVTHADMRGLARIRAVTEFIAEQVRLAKRAF
ncbi:LysR family transcriptional regulator [Brevundimonas sp. 2R-24]|uniref:LysR family transcriptional regulator n=1 Tax=Peiella sedimenti TaxID=3061083 RepID=A0ABT8SLF9_9CAUL|nr:LysR family transcriptional regulator [Caulobacteraceae bacterium XZ-24]